MSLITDLNQVVVASSEGGSTGSRDFGPIPKGTYNLKLLEVGEWKPRPLSNVRVISYDDRFQKLKDPSGNDIVKVVNSITIYENNLKFEVVDGPYKGRWIFHRVSTHPNRPWEIPNLLSGLGESTLKLSELSTLKGRTTKALVDIDSYEKKVVDEETGLEQKVPTEKNVVKRFNRKTDADIDKEADTDLDI